jgi:hypothetical protein
MKCITKDHLSIGVSIRRKYNKGEDLIVSSFVLIEYIRLEKMGHRAIIFIFKIGP